MKLLAIDGGGIRGIYASHVLERIQKEFKTEFHSEFDLIAGTSTGSIIAAAIAFGIPISKVQYAGEFSIDVVPCIRRASIWETTEWILNRKDDVEEQANPDGYTEWFLQRNGYVGNNQLIKVVRILKYLRDFKLTFSAKSILLTTLIGERISWLDELGNEFSDTPTALWTVIKRLDA